MTSHSSLTSFETLGAWQSRPPTSIAHEFGRDSGRLDAPVTATPQGGVRQARSAVAGDRSGGYSERMNLTELQVSGFERLVRAEDAGSGLRALIAIHDTTLGPALGGLRMWPFRSWDEAQFDVLRLARGMTYKSAIADTGLGGGKGIILGNPKTDKTDALFHAMGDFIEALGGRYITAEDVGTSVSDMEKVRERTRWVTGLPRSRGSSGDPSPWTALGVFRGQKACLEDVFGNGDFADRTVAIQGMGSVGAFLAEHLKAAGARLVVADVAADRARAAGAHFAAQVVGADAIYEVPCDIFAPCALGAVINDDTIRRLRCKIVAGAANNVLLREDHGDRLREMGVLYAPDYVINAGGIINVSCEVEPQGYDEARSRAKVENIYNALRAVFRLSRERGISTNRASNLVAEAKLAEGRARRGR